IDLRGFEWGFLNGLANSAAQLTLKGHNSPVKGVAYSPDGRFVASGSWDLTVGIWDVATGKKVHSLRDHTYVSHGVAFSRDGQRLASAGGDKTARVWDT